MNTPKYSVNQQPIQSVICLARSGQIAILEIQRPFVWDGTSKARTVHSEAQESVRLGEDLVLHVPRAI